MSNIKVIKECIDDEYTKVVEEQKDIEEDIKLFEGYDVVQKYLSMLRRKEETDKKESCIYKAILKKKYFSCKHVLVESYTEPIDNYEGRAHHYYGCIKCGMNEAVWEQDYYRNREEKVMKEILQEYRITFLPGIKTGITMDIYKAKELYDRLREIYPEIDEDVLVDLFKKVVENEREKTVVKILKDKQKCMSDGSSIC